MRWLVFLLWCGLAFAQGIAANMNGLDQSISRDVGLLDFAGVSDQAVAKAVAVAPTWTERLSGKTAA